MKRLLIKVITAWSIIVLLALPGIALPASVTNEPQSIIIVSPVEGDSWAAGSEHPIMWRTTGAIGGTVGLYYRTSSSSKWVYLTTVENTGSYIWEVPMVETHEAQIQAVWQSSQHEDALKYASGVSGRFTIFKKTPSTPFIEITAPNAGDKWRSGTKHTISWKTSISHVEDGTVDLFYRSAPNHKWQFITSVINTGTTVWEVPQEKTTTAQIQAIWKSSGLLPVIYAQTTSREFEIYQSSGAIIPPAPTHLTATAASSSRIKLSWQSPSLELEGLCLERKTSDGAFQEVARIEPNVTKYWDIGLSPSTRYFYRIRAFNADGYSTYSNETSAKTLGQGQPGEVIQLRFYINETGYYLNNQLKEMDVAPILYENRTVLPIRYVSEALYASVGWKESEQKVTLHMIDQLIELWINKNYAHINSQFVLIDPDNPLVTPVIIPPGRTMLPVRFISENLGCQVNWDASKNEVSITYAVP